MKSKRVLLFKTLLLSTSAINKLKTTKDKKKRGKIIGGLIGMGILYLMLMAYCLLIAIGYSYYGLGDKLPGMNAVLISIMSFLLTVLKANSYLFGFREYEMLMALPFKAKTIVGSKFLYMYVKSLPWNISVSLAMLIGYGIAEKPALYVYPLWLVLSVILPLIPMLLASLVGFVIARIGTAFRQWRIIQTILIFIFVMLSVMSRFIIDDVVKNNETEDILNTLSDTTDSVGTYYLPVQWFEKAVTEGYVPGILLLVLISVVLFETVFVILSLSYRKINSKMKVGVSKKNYKFKAQKQRSVVSAIAAKEIKRFFGSTTYLVNVGLGYIFAILAGLVTLFLGLDKVIATMTNDAPVTMEMVLPAIPFVVYFMTGMMPMTASSPSLEGKNFWIIKSLPIRNKDIYLGKILANLYISIPAQLISTLMMCFSARVGILETFGYLILGVILVIFSATYGCACGLHFLKLDWENEIEVIKQSAGVAVYMFPNMLLTMIMLVGCVILGFVVNTGVVIVIAVLLYSLLSLLFYFRVMKLAKKY